MMVQRVMVMVNHTMQSCVSGGTQTAANTTGDDRKHCILTEDAQMKATNHSNNHVQFSRSGVAFIVVMLIVLSASAIALLSLRIMHNETRTTLAFKYNRQAAQAAHQIGGILRNKARDPANTLTIATEAKNNAIVKAYQASVSSDTSTANKAWEARMDASKWYKQDTFKIYTGLTNAARAADEENRLGGDLSIPVMQSGALGRMTMNQKAVEGFSDGDAFCSESMHADSYALVGRAIPLRTNAANNQYYLLSDLNSRISGYKREMGVFEVEPIPCK